MELKYRIFEILRLICNNILNNNRQQAINKRHFFLQRNEFEQQQQKKTFAIQQLSIPNSYGGNSCNIKFYMKHSGNLKAFYCYKKYIFTGGSVIFFFFFILTSRHRNFLFLV